MKRQEGTLTPELASFVDTYSHLALQLPGQLARLYAEIEQTEAQMRALAEKGLVRAVPDWRTSRKGEYLTLVFPAQEDGKRPRQFIGRDPAKVKEALDGLDRAEEYDRLQCRLYDMMAASLEATSQISKARDALICGRRFS
jgi:hypothetical protein